MADTRTDLAAGPSPTNILDDIAALSEDLCDPRQHIELLHLPDKHRHRRKLTHVHRTVQPGLLAQLAEAVQSSAGQTDEAGDGYRPVPGSRPPLCLEALARHASIQTAAVRWCWSLQLDLRDTVESNIRALVGAASTMDSDTRAALVTELRRWRTWAAVMTGWQSPLFAPRVACPACGQLNTIRINLARRVAFCLGREFDEDRCGSEWTPDTIGVLAEHIRRTTEAGISGAA